MGTLNPVCVGIDIGQVNDFTAISVAEVASLPTGKHRLIKRVDAHLHPTTLEFIPGKETEPVMRSQYTIRMIKRLALGTDYPSVAVHLADMLCNDTFQSRDVRVLFDITGVGRPVFQDLLKEIGLRPKARHIRLKPVSFVHGESYNKIKCTLGKAYLVSRLQSLLQSARVQAPDTSEVRALLEELRVYEIKISAKGTDQYGAFDTGKHDDMATALGLSILEDPFADRVLLSERMY